MQRVAIYMRVSTAGQVQEGESLAAQRTALLDYIKSHSDMALAGEYIDEGISGQKYEQRGDLQRLLRDVEKGLIDLVLVTKLDRLHRSLKNFLVMQETLEKHGCKWLCIWEPMYDTTTPSGQLVVNQMVAIAQFEAQNTGQRIRHVMDYKAQQGEVLSGKVPLGYRIENKHLVPCEEAESTRKIFAIYAQSGSLHYTLTASQGIPGAPRSMNGLKWLLTNRKYIGEHRGNTTYCPPIIDRWLFDDVQAKLALNVSNTKTHNTRIIFPRLIVCGNCGARFHSHPFTHVCKDGTITERNHYRCDKHYSGLKTCPNGKTIADSTLEKHLLTHLKEAMREYVLDCEVKEKPISDNKKQIENLERRKAKLKELFLNDLISLEEYKKDKDAIEKALNDIATMEEAQPPDTSHLKELLSQDIVSVYNALSDDEKRTFWRTILKEIRFDSDRNISFIFR